MSRILRVSDRLRSKNDELYCSPTKASSSLINHTISESSFISPMTQRKAISVPIQRETSHSNLRTPLNKNQSTKILSGKGNKIPTSTKRKLDADYQNDGTPVISKKLSFSNPNDQSTNESTNHISFSIGNKRIYAKRTMRSNDDTDDDDSINDVDGSKLQHEEQLLQRLFNSSSTEETLKMSKQMGESWANISQGLGSESIENEFHYTLGLKEQ